MEKNDQKAYIRGLCEDYIAACRSGDEIAKNRAGDLIYGYCYEKYFYLINTYGAEREDVFQTTMAKVYTDVAASFLQKSRSNTFEAFFLLTAKGVAYNMANEKVGKNTANSYAKIKDISEQYCIPINVGNAHKFAKILNNRLAFSTNKVISAIEGYATEVSLESIVEPAASY